MITDTKKYRRMIQTALDHPEQFVLRIRYKDMRGKRTERTVTPYRWADKYTLLGRCLGRDALRTFKLGRIHGVALKLAMDVSMPEKMSKGKTA